MVTNRNRQALGLSLIRSIYHYFSINPQITRDRVAGIHSKIASLSAPLDILRVTKRVKTITIRAHHRVEVESDYDEEDNTDLKQLKEKEEKALLDLKQNFIKVDEPEVFSPFEYKPVLEDDPDMSNDDMGAADDGNDMTFETVELPLEVAPVPTSSKAQKRKATPEPKPAKEKAVAIPKPKKTYKFNKPKKKPTESFLDPNHWKKSLLNEEEALKVFKARADDPKYPTWPYKCSDCIKGFRKEDIYKRHRILRHNEVIVILISLF